MYTSKVFLLEKFSFFKIYRKVIQNFSYNPKTPGEQLFPGELFSHT